MSRSTRETAYVALGSNLGDRAALMEEACRRLDGTPGISVVRRSTVRETEPVGSSEAPATGGAYLNAVVEVECAIGVEDLLRRCLEIEAEMGRRRTTPNAARTIDLDVLLFGGDVLEPEAPDSGSGSDLCVPHPRLLERRFVLEPLAELAPDMVHPVTGQSMLWHLESLCDSRPAPVRGRPAKGDGEDQPLRPGTRRSR